MTRLDDKDNSKINPIVYQNIMAILHKITILTLFYQFIAMFQIVLRGMITQILGDSDALMSYIILRSTSAFTAFSWSLSMYLMMDHNKEKYLQFLKALRYWRLNYLCCCCKHIVIQQLEYCSSNADNNKTEDLEDSDGHKQITTMDLLEDEIEMEMPRIMPGQHNLSSYGNVESKSKPSSTKEYEAKHDHLDSKDQPLEDQEAGCLKLEDHNNENCILQ